MTKTFKSVNADAKKDLLVVLGVDEGVNIHTESPTGRRGVSVAPSDAPALALAILEAAGYKGILASEEPGNLIEKAYSAIRLHIKEQERITAEAKEQAELEAEALKLLLAFQAIDDPDNRGCEWRQYGTNTKDKWLAVARRAREMRAEK
ncbi:hypothetical protein D3C74_367100 [compost metagenome]